jgi:hypothetical protein
MGNTLSIDLASRRYRDFGFALLEEGDPAPKFPKAAEFDLSDPPEADALAAAIHSFAETAGVSQVLLDGSQGWRHPNSSIEHMRLCERVLNTPGKTGTPGHAKPGTYLNYIQFSIDVFHHLRVDYGWSLLTEDWTNRSNQRWIVEVFPSAAWSLLGLERLPSKSKAGKKLEPWRKSLARVTGYVLPKNISHDELQAAVVLPLGHSLNQKREDLMILAGVDPIIEGDVVYEGVIACPRLTPA